MSVAQTVPVIKANSSTARYGTGADWTRAWTISPRIGRDTLRVNCYGEETLFFVTDRDSIRVPILPGETKLFYVTLNDTAKALTVVYGVPMAERLVFTDKGDEDSVFFRYGHASGSYMERLANEYPTDHLLINKQVMLLKLLPSLNGRTISGNTVATTVRRNLTPYQYLKK